MPLPYIIVTMMHMRTSPYLVAMSNSGPVNASLSSRCVHLVYLPVHLLMYPVTSAAMFPPMGPTVLMHMVNSSGPPIFLYQRKSKSRCVPFRMSFDTMGIPRSSSGSAALIASDTIAVLKNCATKTFSATFRCCSMKLAGLSYEEMDLTTVFNTEFTMATAPTATPTRRDSSEDGAARKSLHCSRRVAISRSDAY